jgi:Asp-tRNA(Asn)/Glu-tRNA(Gln) amidotransferase A subunit family amidase
MHQEADKPFHSVPCRATEKFCTPCCADMLCRHPIKADAPCVASLKELGAVLLGKAAMVEFGCLATGYNTHLGSTRNPHNRNKASGGSSSGSAAAVAAGLCPIAIGTDGGGSIRIPSSLCGVMGLKPTMGRLADDHGGCACRRLPIVMTACAI